MYLRLILFIFAFVTASCSSMDQKNSCELAAHKNYKCKDSIDSPIHIYRGENAREV